MFRSFQLSIRCSSHQRHQLFLRYYSSQELGSGENAARTIKNTEDENKAPPLPLLQRPLGVKEIPTSVPRTADEKLEDMLDQEKRMQRRRHLYVYTKRCA